MNWIKTNTFLAGLIGVLVIGAGVFGYLIFTGKGRADEAREKIERVKKSYQSSARRDEVPVEAVLEVKEETVKELEAETVKLRAEMIDKYGAKGEGGDAATFGQRVEARYTELRALWEAEGSEMEVPNEFFLGFEKYRSTIQAQPAAVAELDSQLAALSWIVEKSIDLGVDAILKFDREMVKGEERSSSEESDDKKNVDSPFNHYSLVASFRGKESEVRSLLNAIVSADSHLFGVRYVKLRNSKLIAPTRSSVESQVEVAKPAATPQSNVFDFTGFGDESEEEETAVEDPYAGMSDSERRQAEARDRATTTQPESGEEEEVTDTDGIRSNAGSIADFTEEPGKQDAVVFLGEEDVILTVVLDYIIFSPMPAEDEAAE